MVTSDEKVRPPRPVAVASGLLAVVAAVSAVGGIVLAVVAGEASGLLFVLLLGFVALIPAMMAHGLWNGYRGSMVTTVVLGAIAFPAGLVLVALVVGPRSSREWFSARAG